MSWPEVTKAEPCIACGKRDWCTRNGTAIFCMRTTEPPVGWHLLKEQSGGRVFAQDDSATRQPTRLRIAGTQPADPLPDFTDEAKRCAEALTPELAAELAGDLGVPVDTLALLRVGWCAIKSKWTFPERAADGRVIGIVRRNRDGVKRSGYGHKRGLTIPANLAELPDPVLLVEGASDVLAALAMSYAVVGRPGNRSGVDMLAELLADRDVLVLGEHDQKDDGKWPGKDGAKSIATGLARAWGKPVPWAMPPASHKDVRAFFVDDATGMDLLEVLREHAQDENPPTLTVKLTRAEAEKKLRGIFGIGKRAVLAQVELCRELADFMDGGGHEAMSDDKGPLSLALVAGGLELSRERVRQLAAAGRTWRRVHVVDTSPFGQLTEAHLRPMTTVDADNQAAVMQRSCEIAREAHVVDQAIRKAEGRRPTKLRLTTAHIKRAVGEFKPQADQQPMSPAAAALCETGRGESAIAVARQVRGLWHDVAMLPGVPRALVEALDMAKQLAQNWADGNVFATTVGTACVNIVDSAGAVDC